MPRIATEDAQTFTVQQDDGSLTPPIAKSDPSYTALKMQEGAPPVAFGAPPPPADAVSTEAAPPGISMPPPPQQQPQQQFGASGTWGEPVPPAAPVSTGAMPPADGPPVQPQIQPAVPAGPQAGDMVTLGTTNNKTSQTIVPEQDKQAIQAGFDQQTAATDGLDGSYTQAQNERDVARSKQEATLLAEQKQTEEIAKKRAVQEKTFNDELQSKINDYNNTEIKAKGVFDDKNLGQQVLAGVAIALGAAGQALSGTKTNYAIDIFNKAIEQDLDSQKANLQKKGQAVTFTGIVQDAARKAGMADDEARTKVFQLRYKQIDSQLAGIQDQVQTDEQKAKIAGLRGQLATESAKMQAKLDEKNVERTTQTETRPLKPSEVGSKTEGIPLGEAAKTADAAYKMNDSIQDIRGMSSVWKDKAGIMAGKYNTFLAEHGIAGKDTQELYRNLQQMLATHINKLSGTGSSEKEAQRLKETLPRLDTKPEAFELALDDLEKANAREYYGVIRARVRDGVMPKDYQPQKLNSKYTAEYSKGVLTPNTQSTYQPLGK